MTAAEIRSKAVSEIESRRLRAEQEREARQREIDEKFPQIAEINRMLNETMTSLSKLIISHKGSSSETFEKIRESSLQGQQMIKDILRSNGYPEDYLEAKYRCSRCSDTGFTEDGRRCECLERLIGRLSAEELNRSANMPLADFSHFSLDYYRDIVIDGVDCYAKMSEIYSYCIQYADCFTPTSESVFMMGRTGIGKTHLSLAIAKKVTESGYNVLYGSVMNLLRAVEKEHFGRGEQDGDTLSSLIGCDLLIMDDLGSEHHTPFYESTLYNIINSRINLGKPVIISTNLSFGELQDIYNERILSRIAGVYTLLTFWGKDIRQIKRING